MRKQNSNSDARQKHGELGPPPKIGLIDSVKSAFYFAESTDRWLLILGIFMNVLNGAAMPIFINIFGGMINTLGDPASGGRSIEYYVLLQVYIGLASFVVSGLGAASLELAAERQLRVARMAYLRGVLRQDLAWFDSFDSGTLSSRLNQNCVMIRDGIGLKLGQAFQFGTMFLGGYISGFIRSWKMTLVLSGALPLLAISGFFMIRMMTSASRKSQDAYSSAGSVAEEILSGIRTVVAFSAEKLSLERYSNLLDGCMREGMRGGFYSGGGLGVTLGVMFCSFSLGFWYGGKMIYDSYSGGCVGTECFRGGDALTVFFCVLIAAFSLGQAGPPLNAFMQAGGAVVDMRKIIERETLIDPYDEEKGISAENLVGDIKFRNVKFAFPGRPDRFVYSNLNLHIPAGKTVALVGPSGCGKSTATQLLLRFYDPQEGSIEIDGTDVREFNPRSFRNQCAIVSQEPRLFARSIFENIKDGRIDATFGEIEAAAASANAMNFIAKFPDSMDTFVGEGGGQLSGGQKQRIAIARAMLRDPKILILDEATSALDNESEKIVQMTLDKLLAEKKRTTIIIAHRLSTVRHADKIVVLNSDANNNGSCVAEEGTHEELIAKPDGIYRNLVMAQGLETDYHKKRTSSNVESLDAYLMHETPRVSHTPAPRKMSNANNTFTKSSLSNIGSFLAGPLRNLSSVGNGTADAKHDESTMLDAVLIGGKDGNELYTPPQPQPVKYSRVLGLLKPYKKEVALGVAGSIAAGSTFPLYAVLLGKLITVYFYTPVNDVVSEASYYACWFLGLAALAFIATSTQRIFMEFAGHRLVKILRRDLFSAMLSQEIAFFDHPDHSTGMLSDLLSSDVLLMKGLSSDNLGVTIQNISTLCFAVVIAFTASWRLALVALACFLVIVPASFIQMKFETGQVRDHEGEAKTAGHVINEAVMNIRVINAYNLQQRILSLYGDVLETDYYSGARRACIGGFFLGLANLLQFCTQAVPMYYGGKLLEWGMIPDAGKMLTATTAVLSAAMGLGQSAIFATDVGKGKAAASKVFAIIDNERREGAEVEFAMDFAEQPKDEIVGDIEVKELKFRYPMRPEVRVFSNMNFRIAAGETVALVGASGCGKSTIIQLLERFYDPVECTNNEGIFLDGRKIERIKHIDLRRQIGLVGQEPILFDTTIAENIRYGKQRATEEEIIEAAKMSNAHNFISEFPEGYATKVGKQGGQLSGGQKQRIAIARAIIRKPKLLLLDEATSALDSESEKQVQSALDELIAARAGNMTIVIIAHRLSTVRNCDKIIVLANPDNTGSVVVEVGNHEELMKIEKGVYRGLVNVANATGDKQA